MNQLKNVVHRRTSRAPTMKRDVRRILTSVCAPRPAAFNECLELALSRRGEMHWEGVQEMVRVLHQELVSPEDALETLKPYLRSNMPSVILKILTIVDVIILNCGERFFASMISNKWHLKISRLTTHSDNKVRHASLQLISNYSQTYNGTVFGDKFSEIVVSLTTNGFRLPCVVLPCIKYDKNPIDSANVDENIIRGIDFLNFDFPEEVPSEESQDEEDQILKPDEAYQTIERIELDVEKLMEAIAECHRVAKTFRQEGCSRTEVLEQLNMAWIVAEKCHVWSEYMQEFLIKDLGQEDLTRLLVTHDRLSDGLRSWEGLVSMDIISGAKTDNESGSSTTDLCRRLRKTRIVADSAIDRLHSPTKEVERLRADNERLRAEVSDLETAKQAALLEAEAEYRKSLKDVKSKAGRRIKDLRQQLEGREMNEKRLERTAEDALFKLHSANQALQDKDQETGRLEAADIRTQLENRVEEARRYQIEIENQLQQQKELNTELVVQLSNREDELESERAAARADTAKYQARIGQLTRELDRVRKEAEQANVQEYEDLMANLRLELKRESILRKKAFNHIRELKGNIRVLARIRPASSGTDQALATHMHDEYTIEHVTQSSAAQGLHRAAGDALKRYEFDTCFGPEATQADIYAETHSLVQSALDGYNVCIFCYGQTGSGKTHTHTGTKTDPGIVPRFVESLFQAESTAEQTTVTCYMLELYQDDLVDLLSPTSMKSKMHIRVDPDTGLVSVKGATQIDVHDAAELKATFESGLRRRKTATTRCNISSSRSHLIFTVLLERKNLITGCRTKSKVTFVDLAGSERVVKSGAVNDKERLNEAKAINKSLSALGDVVSSLTAKESFVPYRNHKLTELMRDSLGGKAKTLMIINVSPLPSDAKETQNTLDYAMRAKQITNENSRSYETREIARLKSLCERQARDIQQLREQALS